MGSHLRCKRKIRQDTLNTNYSNDSIYEHANQGTRMTLQVKPQASIPVSTYYQEAFVSPFAASRILEQRIYEPTNRRTTRPRDVKKRKVIELKFLSMLFLYYIKSCQVSIRLDTA